MRKATFPEYAYPAERPRPTCADVIRQVRVSLPGLWITLLGERTLLCKPRDRRKQAAANSAKLLLRKSSSVASSASCVTRRGDATVSQVYLCAVVRVVYSFRNNGCVPATRPAKRFLVTSFKSMGVYTGNLKCLNCTIQVTN